MSSLCRHAIRFRSAAFGSRNVRGLSSATAGDFRLAPIIHAHARTAAVRRPRFLSSESGDDFVMTPEMAVNNISCLLERELHAESHPGLQDPDHPAQDRPVDPTEMSEDLKELSKDIMENWRVVDDSGGRVVRMFRKEALKPGGAKVSIFFDIQDGMGEEEDLEEEDGDEEEGVVDSNAIEEDEEEEGGEIPPGVSFTMTLTRAGRTLAVSCVASDAVYVQGITVLEEDGGTGGGAGGSAISDDILLGSQYRGPAFDELDKELQDSAHDYVRYACGLTEDVAAFIVMYSDHKEQCEYISWLQKFQGFLR